MVRTVVVIGALMFCFGRADSQMSEPQTAPDHGPHATTRQIQRQQVELASGSPLTISLIEVSYPPGGASPVHSHPCPVVGYVESGAVRMKVEGEVEHVFKAGESFAEAANSIHAISANASQTEPAVFLAFFACDHDQPLSVETKAGASR
jgi:quercetin dioxygenase-like cupin family protein